MSYFDMPPPDPEDIINMMLAVLIVATVLYFLFIIFNAGR